MMTEEHRADAKRVFLDAYERSLAVMGPACQAAGVSRATVRRWRCEDGDFDAQCVEVEECQTDMVEGAFLKNIKDGNVQAQVRYLTSKRAASRGYVPASSGGETDPDIERFIEVKKMELTGILKAEGRYSDRLSEQVEIAAASLVLARRNYGRADRESQMLCLNSLATAQRALRALGMNIDAKGWAGGEDESPAGFLSNHKMEDE